MGPNFEPQSYAGTVDLAMGAAQRTDGAECSWLKSIERHDPRAVAVSCMNRSTAYGELNRRSNRLARRLEALGVGTDVIVGLCMERSVEMVVGALGILKGGGAYLPLDPSYPPERLAFMLHDAQAGVVVTNDAALSRLPAGPWLVVNLDSDHQRLARYSADPLAYVPCPGDLAYVIYTSGSTGRPKGVLVPHAGLANLVAWHNEAFDITGRDRASHLAALGFDAAVWELWPYLAAGAGVHLVPDETRVDPERLRDWMIAAGITIAFAPTVLAERLIALPWPPDTPLRYLLTGADKLHRRPPESLPFTLVNNYGPTECSVVATSAPVAPETQDSGVPSIGRPISNTTVHILRGNLEPAPAGQPGEIFIGGAGVARGYLNRPDLTAEKFVPDPFQPGARLYRTGDLGRFLADGRIEFLGRVDEQIKIHGFRVEPGEIVAALNSHPMILESAVAARGETEEDRQLVAYIVPRPGASLTSDELQTMLRTLLPDHMVPRVFVRLDSLPQTPAGKLDRRALPPPDAENSMRNPAADAGLTGIEQRLSAIVAGLLKVDGVGPDENFFMLGGNSLLGAQVIAAVRDAFGVQVGLRNLFSAPTITGLAREVARLSAVRQG